MLFINTLALLGAVATASAAAVAPFTPAPSSLVKPAKSLDVKLGITFDSSVEPLTKRATEGVHLVNCQGNGLAYSIIIYCGDDSNCNFQPSSNNQCFMKSDGLFTWEGKTAGCSFTSGVTFTYTLPGNAWSQPQFSRVGSANNRFRNFDVYHDNSRVMYTAGNGATCRSIYYAI